MALKKEKESLKKYFKNALFLGYKRSQTRIFDNLINKGCHVTHTSDPVKKFDEYDFAVSFG